MNTRDTLNLKGTAILSIAPARKASGAIKAMFANARARMARLSGITMTGVPERAQHHVMIDRRVREGRTP